MPEITGGRYAPVDSEQQQAALFYARERRRSLAGLPRLFKTHLIRGVSVMETTLNPGQLFPNPVNLGPVTFQTAIVFADNTDPRSGLIFEFGSISGGGAMWVTDTTIAFRAGNNGGATESLTIEFDNVAQWPAGLELDITVACIPGIGSATMWLNGEQVVTGNNSGNFGITGWAFQGAGSFATVSAGSVPTGVPTTAPANFTVVEPLSVYARQRPRQYPA